LLGLLVETLQERSGTIIDSVEDANLHFANADTELPDTITQIVSVTGTIVYLSCFQEVNHRLARGALQGG